MVSRKVKGGREGEKREKIIKNVKCAGINKNITHLFFKKNDMLKHTTRSVLKQQTSGKGLQFRWPRVRLPAVQMAPGELPCGSDGPR